MIDVIKCTYFSGRCLWFNMKQPLVDYGTPEEEAMRWRVLPWYIRYPRVHDTYPFKVKYYDKPDGQDLLGKLIACNRNTVPYGIMYGIIDSLMHSPNISGVQARIGRVVHFTWPAAACATTFTTVTYFATKLRQKDDGYSSKCSNSHRKIVKKTIIPSFLFFSLNYGLGAIAAGSVVGAWQRSHVTGWVASLFFCKYQWKKT